MGTCPVFSEAFGAMSQILPADDDCHVPRNPAGRARAVEAVLPDAVGKGLADAARWSFPLVG